MVANALGRAVKIFKLKLIGFIVLLNANSRIDRHFCMFMYELRQNNNLDEIRYRYATNLDTEPCKNRNM